MKILRGSLGLGDAIYLYPVVKKYLMNGEDVMIVTRYPEIYANLNCKTIGPDDFIDCQCSARTKEPETNIYEDTLIMSGIEEKPPFVFEFCKNTDIKVNTDKKICVIRNLSYPVKGDPSAGVMIPNMSIFQDIINTFKESVYFISIGWQINCDSRLSGIDLDLSETKNLKDYLTILDLADIVLTQPGHCVPIAESLNRKVFCVFARAGLESEEKRYQFTTPKKILTKPTSGFCVDDEFPKDYLVKFRKLLLGE